MSIAPTQPNLDAFHCRLCDGLLIDNGNSFEAEVARHQDGACFGAVVA